MHLQEAGNAQTFLHSQDRDIADFFLSANKMQIQILSLGIFHVKRGHYFFLQSFYPLCTLILVIYQIQYDTVSTS